MSPFLKKMEDLIIALKEKLKVSEKYLAYFTSRLNKMMASSKILNYILINTKMFVDK